MKRENCKWLSSVFCDRGTNAGLLLLRVYFGGMMFTHGLAKIMNFSEMSSTFFDPIGLGQQTSFLLMTLTEFGASLFVIFGLLTRLSALPLIFGMAVAAFIVHAPFSLSGSELPLLYLGAFTVIAVMGGGKYSLDYLIKRQLFPER